MTKNRAPLEPYKNPVRPGFYKHARGMDYEVVGMARHSETLEEFVVYRALYGTFDLWIRPAAMFVETITFEGKEVSRFTFVSEKQG